MNPIQLLKNRKLTYGTFFPLTMPTAGLVVTVLIIIAGITDLVFVLFGGVGSSISNFLINAGFKSPVFVFATGFVCGHLFGYMTLSPSGLQKTGSLSDSKEPK